MPRSPVWLCFEKDHQHGRGVWAVKYKGKWINGDAITCKVSTRTRYRGKHARQPKAYLFGLASSVVKTPSDRLVIS